MEETRGRLVDTNCSWCDKSIVNEEKGIVTMCMHFLCIFCAKKSATDWSAMPNSMVQISAATMRNKVYANLHGFQPLRR